MKNKSYIFLLTFFAALSALLFSFSTKTTSWTFIKSITVPQVKKVSADRYYNFYIADNNGNIYKYDTLGVEVNKYSPQRKGNVTLLEAWKTVNVFLFYRELQEYNVLDRFLTTSNPNSKINPENQTDGAIGFARLATVAPDNNLWVFDDNDFSLKKFETRLNKVIINTSLDLILDPHLYDLSYMREYQNFLFIADKNSGILIFDNLGNYKRTLPYTNVEYFNFIGNNLYFLQDKTLKVLDIYSGIEKSISIPEGKTYQYVLFSSTKVYFFGSNCVDIYQLPASTFSDKK